MTDDIKTLREFISMRGGTFDKPSLIALAALGRVEKEHDALCAKFEKATGVLRQIDDFEVNALDSMVNQVFRLKNMARAALAELSGDAPAQDPRPSQEIGWVIERGDSEPCAPTYWAGPDRWSQSHLDAIRFTRKIDADHVSARLSFPNNRVCEHIWSDAPALPPIIDDLVNRFLMWPLPKTVCSDLCVSDRSYKFPRSGTNLLSAEEARAMVEYLFDGISLMPAQISDEMVEAAWDAFNRQPRIEGSQMRAAIAAALKAMERTQ